MAQSQGDIHANLLDGKKKEIKYNTRFKQQTLPHLRINVSPAGLASLTIVIGVLFIPTGSVLIYSAGQAKEVIFDYTNQCPHKNSSLCPTSKLSNRTLNYCCNVTFTLRTDFTGKVYIYYGLTKFHQNHRMFSKSRDDRQLYGGTGKPAHECKPFDFDKNSSKPLWPCGALANAMFQDRLKIYYLDGGSSGKKGPGEKEIKVQRTGIAWKSDISYKFKNPPGWKSPKFQKEHAPPAKWRILPWELDDGLQNEDFVIWMRVAALPEFRKVYGIVDGDMRKGKYRMEVEHNFDVKSFDGTKSIIIATKAMFGGKNPFLGIVYVSLGVLFVITGLFFLYIYFNSLSTHL